MSIRVLIIEDDEDDYVIMSHYLYKIKTADYQVEWCNDYDLATAEILKDEHDIYLIDHFLGKGEGIQIIATLRRRNFIKPLILLTGAGDISVDEEAMAKGASDFLIKKEIRVDTLERAMRYAIERYHQQRHIRSHEKRYRSLFELSLEPFLVLDHEFNITEFNAAFVEFIQDKMNLNNQLIGTSFHALIKYDFDVTSLKDRLKKDGYIKGFKTTLADKNNDAVVVLSIAHLPANEPDEEVAYHVALSDLTTIMEQQSELKKAEKLNMSGRMARMIAHEVRNPLTNINLALGELAAVTKENEEAQLFEKMIDRNSSRIADLIDELLKSARPPELEKIPFLLDDIVEAALHFCKDRMELLDVQLNKQFDITEVEGEWDPDKLKIALVNIFINAIEAMTDVSHPILTVTLQIEDDQPLISIQDNGKGMSTETINNLYDPFFTKRKNGLGLGMTATFNIIQMHKGKIYVDSEVDKGTVFKIYV